MSQVLQQDQKSLFGQIKQQYNQFLSLFPKIAKSIVWTRRILLCVLLIDIGYMIAIWPDWKWYADGPFIKSQFIEDYERKSWQNRQLPKLRWQPVGWNQIPDTIINAVLAAEDSRFYRHAGIDTEAFKKAMEYNWEKKRFIYGASTISQQTVKNLFLSSSRNPLRKWHELILTFAMELNLKKSRILNIYLNIAEFGPGIFGVEAAAKYYWGISASNLNEVQAVELAATLPAPSSHNPKRRSSFFMKQRSKILKNIR